ncbi:hypothetical protein B0A55_07945 [Friedmanniomyces simplex]|uniref:Uncharacterized protein n=1 Tax=Friedmanniomyces simplex TaxID=329884 RepID=A0A4U0WTK7_9PEZI|nr:hypothetical protein B0A55_07945 [Friedmanniomyces simplex]
MRSAASRALSTSAAKAALPWVGGSEAEILNKNPGKDAVGVIRGINQFAADSEQKYPRAAYVKIQGTTLHQSHKDPETKSECITVGIHTKNDTRVVSGHVYADGKFQSWESRAGKKQSKGQRGRRGDEQDEGQSAGEGEGQSVGKGEGQGMEEGEAQGTEGKK